MDLEFWQRTLSQPTAVMFYVLFTMQVIDVFMGWGAALANKEVASRVSIQGVIRKVMAFLLVVSVAVIEPIAKQLIPGIEALPLTIAAQSGLIVSEFFSINESAKRAGVSIPLMGWLIDRLAVAYRTSGEAPSYTVTATVVQTPPPGEGESS